MVARLAATIAAGTTYRLAPGMEEGGGNRVPIAPDDMTLGAAKFQGRRVVAVTARFLAGQKQ